MLHFDVDLVVHTMQQRENQWETHTDTHVPKPNINCSPTGEDENVLNNELHIHPIVENEAVPLAGEPPWTAFCPLQTLKDKAA